MSSRHPAFRQATSSRQGCDDASAMDDGVNFLQRASSPTVTEYALIAGALALAIVAALHSLGGKWGPALDWLLSAFT